MVQLYNTQSMHTVSTQKDQEATDAAQSTQIDNVKDELSGQHHIAVSDIISSINQSPHNAHL